jgi:iron(III) transport system substrate-binding protein
MIDRRRVLQAAGAALLIPSAARAEDELGRLYDDAKREGEITWYIAQIDSDAAERVGKLFGDVYPGVRANVVRATGQVVYQRLMQDEKVGVRNCDVFGTTDLGHTVALKRSKLLAAYAPKNLAACDPLFRDFDPEHFVTCTGGNCTSLVFSSSLAAADAPRDWKDLVDPKWSGQVAVGHPGYSGAMGAWVVEMEKRFGWSFFDALARNKPLVSRSLVDPPNTIASGERKIGLGPSNLILTLKNNGRPVDIAYPSTGVILQVAPTSVMASAPHPNAARLFLEFLLSTPAGKLLAADFGIPMRTDVQRQPGVADLASLSIIRPSPEELEKKVPEVVEKWRDTFGV